MKKFLPNDIRSKGEQKIASLLSMAKINYEVEKSFSDLRNGKYRFDFYLPSDQICIEYDGKQHFEQTKYFQKKTTDFYKQQEHDRRKNSYCLANKIKLYRIPYWELNNIYTFNDLFLERFLVKNRYHNDILWRNHKK